MLNTLHPPRLGQRLALAALCCCPTLVWAAEPASSSGAALPMRLSMGAETVQLPGHERMGLVSGKLLFDIGHELWLGPVTYGAATGQRGGFFVGGIELQRRWALPGELSLSAGLSVGGGGGAGAPVGNGLMLRPALTLMKELLGMRLGASVSTVRFPGTAIHSHQMGLVLEWPANFQHVSLDRLGERLPATQRSGVGFDRIALTGARYALAQGQPEARRFGLVGVRLDQDLATPGRSWGVEAAAGAQAHVAGYMEILAHLGQEVALGEHLRLGLRGAIGLGGGGTVPTGGGVIERVDGTLSLALPAAWQLGASLGRVHGRTQGMQGQRTELWLAHSLEPSLLPGQLRREGTAVANEWGAALLHIAPMQRNQGTRQSIETIGLVLNHGLGDHAYLTAQTYSALAGAAGGYSIGLLGAGWASGTVQSDWRYGAELLAGGAGGGGVRQASGALVQTQLWASRLMAAPGQRLRLSVGALASARGGSPAPVAAITWSRSFAVVGP